MLRKTEIAKHKFKIPILIFILTFSLLAFVQVKLERPIILAERFIKGAGWVKIILISIYGSFVGFKMQDPLNVPRWRKITWTLFSFVFFSQLFIGLSGIEKFLMTGKLHLPVPMMIIAGPIYRGQLSVMTILFLSTVVLTGPAWCSQFCYCGDCLAGCHHNSIKYKFLRMHPERARNLYLILTISLHAACIALARI
jgi:ferredoxin-type protein NapH